MTDAALRNAFDELKKLQDERERIHQRISKLTGELSTIDGRMSKVSSFIQAWYEFAGEPVPVLPGIAATGHATGKATVGAVGKIVDNPKKEVVTEAALELIAERGAPIARPELHELLKARGLEVRGADPLVTLSTMLWRMRDKIVHFQGLGYWDATKPYAPANSYAPEVEDSPGPT
jgi:hypothetical protein